MTAPAFTSRRWRTWREKRPAFVDWRLGQGVHAGGGFQFRPQARLLDFLEGMPPEVERVFVLGPRIGDTPDGLRAWLTGRSGEWVGEGHYLEDTDSHTLRFVGPEGRRLSVVRAAAWLGEGDYLPIDAWSAWSLLGATVASAFPGGTLLATAASTGRDLLVRSMGENVYPLASPEHQDLIRQTTGQGRTQLLSGCRWEGDDRGLTVWPPDPMPGLAEYDGRLMYGALCRELGSGVAEDIEAGGPASQAALAAEFDERPYRRARYLIHWRVPSGWDRVGLVGRWDDGWTYPSIPGNDGTSWVDGAELLLMARYGWPFAIVRRLTLHPPIGPGPLDRWAKKLVGIRELLLMARQEGGGRPYELAAAGARALLLHAIGAFTGSPHLVTKTAPLDQGARVPNGAIGVRIEGETLVWGERQATAWPELAHPEWSAAVWARCRARLLSGPGDTGALHVPAETVVAFRTDALYLTERQDWPDDGKAGRLRLVRYVPGPLRWPRSQRELLAMREGLA